MTWHTVVKVESDDAYEPTYRSGDKRMIVDIYDRNSRWVAINNLIDTIWSVTESLPDHTTIDLLHLAVGVYSADRNALRSCSSDQWTRQLVLHVPVMSVRVWQRSRTMLETLLGFLTGDDWKLKFRKRSGIVCRGQGQPSLFRGTTVTLFSGGMDSLVGAIDLLEAGERVLLVSYYGGGTTSPVQNAVADVLERAYPGCVERAGFHCLPPSTRYAAKEPSMRSRSFLFLALGVAMSQSMNEQAEFVVSENGLISLNSALTASRLGSLSTRTTHPYYLSLFERILKILGIVQRMRYPYRFQTKGEMLIYCKNRGLLEKALPLSMSCSHPETGRWNGESPNNHCGYCVPCIIRRASLYRAGYDSSLDRPRVDVLSDELNSKLRVGSDLRAWQMAIRKARYDSRRQSMSKALVTGPLPPADIDEYTSVYRRGIREVSDFLRQRDT